MRNIVAMVAALLLSSLSIAENTKGKSKYVSDIAFLHEAINKYYAPLAYFDKKMRNDIMASFRNLRRFTDTVTTDQSFAAIVQQSLLLLNDGHASLVGKNVIKYYLTTIPQLAALGGVTSSDTLLADLNLSYITDSVYSKVRCGLRFKYLNGEYFNVRPFTFNGRQVAAGEKLQQIDGVDIDSFIAKNRHKLTSLRYDMERNKWYDEHFFLSLPGMHKDTFKLQIGGTAIDATCSKSMNPTKKEHSVTSTPYSTMIDSSTFYLRIPVMFGLDFYKKEIQQGVAPSAKKVILDIRGNRGGQDKVWMGILSELINEPLAIHTSIAINRNSSTQKVLDALQITSENLNRWDTLKPSATSVSFKGTIYILQDSETYSAASSISSIAWQSDRIKLVGNELNRPGGRGITPLIIRLPNSGLVFRLPFTADRSGRKHNPFSTKVEILIEEKIDDYLNRILNNDSFSPEYIKKNDSNVKFILKDN